MLVYVFNKPFFGNAVGREKLYHSTGTASREDILACEPGHMLSYSIYLHSFASILTVFPRPCYLSPVVSCASDARTIVTDIRLIVTVVRLRLDRGD